MSIILISGIIIIHSQLNYIKNKDLGFSINQQLVFSFHTNETKNKITLFADALRQLPEVKSASITNNYPGAFGYNDWGVFLAGGDPAHSTDQQNISTDEYSMKALGIHLKSGRDFHYNDSGAALVNETLAKKLGLDPENAAGTMLFTEGDRKYKIAGVMKDFNYRTLRDDVYPFMLIYDPSRGDLNNIIVNISSNNFTALTSKMENIWKNILPSAPFEYVFLDDEMQKLYQSDITMSRIINSFTLMAILISCLGLFGLAAFSAEQRKKEIGIRKVLGAKVSGIVQLLSQDFLKLVMVAFIIAIPISWWAMSQWLKSFAYRITPTWWMFGFAGLIAVIIAFITVSFIALKSALINPVSNLRTE
jgi:putative ABC transport system permease protein